jgi:hypothetical protein
MPDMPGHVAGAALALGLPPSFLIRFSGGLVSGSGAAIRFSGGLVSGSGGGAGRALWLARSAGVPGWPGPGLGCGAGWQ